MLSERLLELVEKNELRETTREIVLDEFKQKNLLGLLELMLDKTSHFYGPFCSHDIKGTIERVFDWVERNPKLLLKWIINEATSNLPPFRLSDELINLGLDYNAPSGYYSVGHKWKNVDALRKAVINNVPGDFYRECMDMDLDNKHFNTIKSFSESEKSDKSGYDIWGHHKSLEDAFFGLINLYGEKIINWAKNDAHLLDVLPLTYYGSKDYVELIKPHLSKKYWKKLINRSFILFAQDYIKECLTGEKKNSLEEVLKNNSVGAKQLVKSLDEEIINNYDNT